MHLSTPSSVVLHVVLCILLQRQWILNPGYAVGGGGGEKREFYVYVRLGQPFWRVSSINTHTLDQMRSGSVSYLSNFGTYLIYLVALVPCISFSTYLIRVAIIRPQLARPQDGHRLRMYTTRRKGVQEPLNHRIESAVRQFVEIAA